MEQIKRIMRPTDVPDTGLLCDLLWSDPDKDIIGWGENDRGVSFTFGEDIVAQFLRRHDLDLICRAHQVVEDGYEFFARRQLVTLFSAPNYCGEFDNAGAMMSVDETLMCSFQVNARRMHWRGVVWAVCCWSTLTCLRTCPHRAALLPAHPPYTLVDNISRCSHRSLNRPRKSGCSRLARRGLGLRHLQARRPLANDLSQRGKRFTHLQALFSSSSSSSSSLVNSFLTDLPHPFTPYVFSVAQPCDLR